MTVVSKYGSSYVYCRQTSKWERNTGLSTPSNLESAQVLQMINIAGL